LNSFLENFSGGDKAVPKLALYRLWLGTRPDALRCLTRATGDGIWGQLGGCYFLAEGEQGKLRATFASLEKTYGRPTFGGQGKELPPIPDDPLPADLVRQLEHLPQAETVDRTFYAPEDGKTYAIRSAKSGKRLAVRGGSKKAGAELVQDNSLETPAAWRLEKAGDGFRIVGAAKPLAVEAAGGSVRVQPRRDAVSPDQVWRFVRAGDAYHIESARDGRVLDVESGSDSDGARVILYGRHPGKPADNQLWLLTEVKP
jgi:hypothetical protein